MNRVSPGTLTLMAQHPLPITSCRWCHPLVEWCEYHASDPALHKYVAAGDEGWFALARDEQEHRRAKAAEDAARQLALSSFRHAERRGET